jgi:hypothetical protein
MKIYPVAWFEPTEVCPKVPSRIPEVLNFHLRDLILTELYQRVSTTWLDDFDKTK